MLGVCEGEEERGRHRDRSIGRFHERSEELRVDIFPALLVNDQGLDAGAMLDSGRNWTFALEEELALAIARPSSRCQLAGKFTALEATVLRDGTSAAVG